MREEIKHLSFPQIRLKPSYDDETFLKYHVHLLFMVCIGLSRKEIAYETKYSIRTIESKLDRLRRILDCKDIAHAIAKAFQKGLLCIDNDGEIIF